MAAKYSTQPSADLSHISLETGKTNPMEAEMISGQVEGQLLQMLVRFGGVTKALDIGTFNGYSALALAEALPPHGRLVTLERETEAARIAASNWSNYPHASKIASLVGDARTLLESLSAESSAFDLVFLHVDEPGYLRLYELLMETGLLRVGGLLVVDNTMYKGEELLGQPLSANGKGVHDLNKALLEDKRVNQVMLPLRDGVTLVHRSC